MKHFQNILPISQHHITVNIGTFVLQMLNPQVQNFLFWISKNHSFIRMLRNLVTFMPLCMWTHKKI